MTSVKPPWNLSSAVTWMEEKKSRYMIMYVKMHNKLHPIIASPQIPEIVHSRLLVVISGI